MTQDQAALIVEAIVADGHEASARDDYSGRCMFGDTTHAVVTDLSAGNVLGCVMNHLVEIAKSDLESEAVDLDSFEFVGQIRQDQMGRGIVLY